MGRNPLSLMQTVAFFCDDIPNGYRLQCQNCLHEDDYAGEDNPPYPTPWRCKKCHYDMYYPPGAEW